MNIIDRYTKVISTFSPLRKHQNNKNIENSIWKVKDKIYVKGISIGLYTESKPMHQKTSSPLDVPINIKHKIRLIRQRNTFIITFLSVFKVLRNIFQGRKGIKFRTWKMLPTKRKIICFYNINFIVLFSLSNYYSLYKETGYL